MNRRSPRRVLVQLDNLELGGAQINAVQLSAQMTGLGFESKLIGPKDTIPKTGDSIIDVAAAYGLAVDAFDRAGSLPHLARQVARHAREHGAALVHAFSTSERPAYWGAALLGRRGLVRTIYEMYFDPSAHRNSPLVVGTGYLKDDLQGWPGGVHLVSPPVDLRRDAPGATDARGFRAGLGVSSDDIAVVVVSRLSREMKAAGIRSAMNAIASIDDSRVVLVVVGTGDAEADLRKAGDRVNSVLGRSAVRFAGSLGDPRPAYDSADIVLGMGSSAARGLAFGKPLVVLGEHGWSETFRESTSAAIFRRSFWSPEVVDEGDSILAGHLRELIADAEMRQSLGAWGRRFAVEHFGLEAMAERLGEIYEDSLRRASRRSWFADLETEQKILVAKGQRALSTATGGRYQGSLARVMDWRQEMPVSERLEVYRR